MTDEELRALVRGAVARHLGRADAPAPPAVPAGAMPTPPWRAHPSFGRFLLVRPEGETACLVEPGVTCNHCGYCQSYGH
ncbi:MAG: hypothetical protein AB7O67_20195 [Vicinamibacterales bacterium]